MKFEKQGNLGKTDLLIRHIARKIIMEDGQPTLLDVESEEIEEQLQAFMHIMSNLNLYLNTLKNDGYSALVDEVEKLNYYFKDYDGSK